MAESVFDFSCEAITGERIPLARFRGHVLLIVNTASYCGFAPQYKGLEFLYRKYKDSGFAVLGFPCHDLLKQEPLNNDRISEFCVRNYGITFPMFSKIKVNGPEADPLYLFLQERAPGMFGTKPLKYNFTKFLVNRDGTPVKRYGPTTFPRRLLRPIGALL